MHLLRRESSLTLFSGQRYELAYFSLRKISNLKLQAEIELPSDWHEYRRGSLEISLGFLTICVSFPWHKTVPDEMQCSGPRYGFYTFDGTLVFLWGKDTGNSEDPRAQWHFDLPWTWRFVKHDHPSEQSSMALCVMRGGVEKQCCEAKLSRQKAHYRRPWLPRTKCVEYLTAEFSPAIGDTESWKGGTSSLSVMVEPGETAGEALSRAISPTRKGSRDFPSGTYITVIEEVPLPDILTPVSVIDPNRNVDMIG